MFTVLFVFRVLQFFNCTSNDYHVIFTSNTSHGLDLIARLFDYRSKKGQNVRVSSLECVDGMLLCCNE